MARWFIYVLRDPVSWDVRYVGKSGRPDARFKQHIDNAPRAKHRNGRWIAKLMRAGTRPLLEVIDSGMGRGHGAAERAWIAEFLRRGARLTNLARGGGGWFGRPPSDVCAKIAATLTGRKLSAETKAKIGAAHVGKTHTEEARRKCRDNNLGKKRSAETCARVSAALVGRPRSAETIAKWRLKVVGQKRGPETGAMISASKIGKPRSAECIAKVAAALTGRRLTDEHRANCRAAQQARRARERSN